MLRWNSFAVRFEIVGRYSVGRTPETYQHALPFFRQNLVHEHAGTQSSDLLPSDGIRPLEQETLRQGGDTTACESISRPSTPIAHDQKLCW